MLLNAEGASTGAPSSFSKVMNEKIEQLLVGPLVWISTLHAAAEVVAGRAQRQRGIDPSEQESEDQVRVQLRPALRELEEMAFRLSALRSDISDSFDPMSAAVARFDSLLVVSRCAQVLEDVHRRLLSLYPVIDEDVVEQTRELAGQCRNAADEDQFADTSEQIFELAHVIRQRVLSEGY